MVYKPKRFEAKNINFDGFAKSPLARFRSWFDTCLTDGEPTTFVGRQASPRTEHRTLAVFMSRSP